MRLFQQRQRFEREVDLAAGMDHPNIVTVFDSGEVDGAPYLAMQYIRGVSFDEYVRDQRPTVQQLLRLMIQVCQA